ncbi:hypothetical protein COT66_00355 [Candidatus Shapirobacteria bacterium CG09_land_8_20_14_0_10_49_15]|uniref:Uncharacterized protein n=1 Tax=Candidatus Shapirobacteria bacterium CG09_land_8_20_14_0_10_49_15 TaxID=1974482 RepID=A0A2M6XBF1_9BACT|nr:MAG: hypothetical protein COT66_00355 [Candidatus Shapirobacteria bacterium CG09_land_8_20_14_0_10_49_15]
MKFIADEAVHFFSAFLIGLACGAIFGQWWLVLVSLASGFFIDADHLFDYFHHFGLKKFRWRNFIKVKTYMDSSGKVFVPLHGWEYLLIFWMIGSMAPFPGLKWTAAGAYLAHLFWDHISFQHHPLFYFFCFRMVKKFNLRLLKVAHG